MTANLQHWLTRTGAALACLVLTALVAGAQPLPVPRPDAEPSTDPIGDLLDRVARQRPVNQAAPVVISLKLQEETDRSRFVVELSDPVDVSVFTLTAPNRVIIDLPEVLWRAPESARPSGRAAIKSYRYGLFRQGNSRFVVDLNRPVRVAEPQFLPPEGGLGFRLILDLYPTTADAFAAKAGWPKDATEAPPEPPAVAIAPAAGKRVIVVDAGHGGIDPGTHGVGGLQEKDVVLAVARRLRDTLEATGRYKVHLTRDRDIFIPLRQRVNIARAAGGDLFVSLHADSNDHRDVRGASVYTLSEDASDREAAKLAEKENMSDVIAGVNLADENAPVASILIDLAQRNTMNVSARFAETLLTSLPGATMVRPSSPHRSAGFAVLKAPDVPAALVELGYLSNSNDEQEMATEAWRNQVARAIAQGIDRHFGVETAPLQLREATR
jgi:N-acetylmuramoyl-L-alanine amidase